MKRLCLLAICLLLFALVVPLSVADRTEALRATEIAFAKAIADRDAKKFFSYIADDAEFLGQRNKMHGEKRK